MTHFNEMTMRRNEGGLLSDLKNAREVAIIATVGVACFFAGSVFGRMSAPKLSSSNINSKPVMVYGKFGHSEGNAINMTPALAVHPDYSTKRSK